MSEQQYVQGKLEGKSLTYDNAGQLTSMLHFVAGELHGIVEFYSQGDCVRRANYKQGALEGESLDFNRHGEIVQRSSYRSNLLDGYLLRYWPGGKIMERTLYSKGSLLAPTDRFDQEGGRVDHNFQKPTFLERLKHLLRGD